MSDWDPPLRVLLLTRYGNGKGAPHHPTAAGHLYRGESIAYLLLLPLLDALYTVLEDVRELSPHAHAQRSALFNSECSLYDDWCAVMRDVT